MWEIILICWEVCFRRATLYRSASTLNSFLYSLLTTVLACVKIPVTTLLLGTEVPAPALTPHLNSSLTVTSSSDTSTKIPVTTLLLETNTLAAPAALHFSCSFSPLTRSLSTPSLLTQIEIPPTRSSNASDLSL